MSDLAQRRAIAGVALPGLGVDPRLPHPVQRQVDAAIAGILANVAGDVGELHGNAEITGAGEARAVAHAHQQRHHRAHRAGHAGAIGMQRIERVIAPLLRIPFKTLDQCAGQFLGHFIFGDDGGKGAVGRMVDRLVDIDGVEPLAQAANAGLGVGLGVHGVISHPAKGIKRGGGGTHPAGQDARGSGKAFGAHDQSSAAGGQILRTHGVGFKWRQLRQGGRHCFPG